jgi:hypothetical protein
MVIRKNQEYMLEFLRFSPWMSLVLTLMIVVAHVSPPKLVFDPIYFVAAFCSGSLLALLLLMLQKMFGSRFGWLWGGLFGLLIVVLHDLADSFFGPEGRNSPVQFGAFYFLLGAFLVYSISRSPFSRYLQRELEKPVRTSFVNPFLLPVALVLFCVFAAWFGYEAFLNVDQHMQEADTLWFYRMGFPLMLLVAIFYTVKGIDWRRDRDRGGDWKFITPAMMTLQDYPCGVSAGDVVSLREDLHYRDHNEQPTGQVRSAGDEAMVLTGNPDEPDVVWIRWRDGKRETWGPDILKTFEVT